MSDRTFARRFGAETGTTPHKWLTQQRILAARSLLEESDLGVEQIATRVGFNSAVVLREHFRREIGLAPVDYRRRFVDPPHRLRRATTGCRSDPSSFGTWSMALTASALRGRLGGPRRPVASTLAGPGQPVLADGGELLAALPQGQRLLQRGAAGLQPLHDLRSARRGPARSSISGSCLRSAHEVVCLGSGSGLAHLHHQLAVRRWASRSSPSSSSA